ncbi:5-oxoprolinase subunit PxpB [Marinicrinis lubricantis]|uniref:5-oxoprolinase subunit PxpB n=1 Tax=Marinicrinis lubricantis TaxID=2086470 RepID=A0ABW1IM30_9BACL
MKSLSIELFPLAENAAVIYFNSQQQVNLLPMMQQFQARIEREPFYGYEEMTTAYMSAALYYDPMKVWDISRGELPSTWVMKWIDERFRSMHFHEGGSSSRLIEIPVCYGGTWGPDLEEAANGLRIGRQELIERHCGPTYTVQMIGFAPGFPYLQGLDPSLAVPRKSVPRKTVAAGSVGIGGGQTGIYPLELPGGWNVIGRTPLRLFMPEMNPPVLIQAGDQIRFVPIDEAQYWKLKQGGE